MKAYSQQKRNYDNALFYQVQNQACIPNGYLEGK